MKLFSRYTRWNMLAMLGVFVLGAGALFFTFRYILVRQLDETLEIEQDEQTEYILQHGKLPEVVAVSDQVIEYRQVQKPVKTIYKTISRQDGDGMQSFRQLSFPVTINGQNYECDVSMPIEQTERLLHAVALVTLCVIALMLLAIYIVNRSLVKFILRPFFNTIGAVRNYSFAAQKALQLPPTSIEEFAVLNQALNDMTARGLNDYQLMRDFSANAAHEMQTPLAVIRTKLEALMQNAGMNEEQARQIAVIDDSLDRLSRLFNSLLLLTKIENNQFPATEHARLDTIISERVHELKEIISSRGIIINLDLQPVSISCNNYLMELLVSNLLNNAIRYNFRGGVINIGLRSNLLYFSNSSHLPPLDANIVFRPFYRHPESRIEGSGLGLSIVRQICANCHLGVSYNFDSGLHKFSLTL